MSTLKADALTTKSDNTDLTITGGGTGVPNLESGFKVGGTAGVPINNLRVGTDGELITWDASGDPAAVAVGTATHILTSNGAGAAPTFQAAAGGGLESFGAQAHDGHALTASAHTLVQMRTETWDTASKYDPSAGNSKWTPASGKVLIVANLGVNSGPASGKMIVPEIYKNGSRVAYATHWINGTSGFDNFQVSAIFEANGSDYFQFYAYHNNASNFNILSSQTYWWGAQIS